MEEMEKRSRRRTRDLVTQAASQGLSQNEIGCARISMMARSTNAPCKGRIQMRKTNPLHFFTFGLQRTAGPYRWVRLGPRGTSELGPFILQQRTCGRCGLMSVWGINTGSPAASLWKSCFAEAVDIHLSLPLTGMGYPFRYSEMGLNLKELGHRLPSFCI